MKITRKQLTNLIKEEVIRAYKKKLMEDYDSEFGYGLKEDRDPLKYCDLDLIINVKNGFEILDYINQDIFNNHKNDRHSASEIPSDADVAIHIIMLGDDFYYDDEWMKKFSEIGEKISPKEVIEGLKRYNLDNMLDLLENEANEFNDEYGEEFYKKRVKNYTQFEI